MFDDESRVFDEWARGLCIRTAVVLAVCGAGILLAVWVML